LLSRRKVPPRYRENEQRAKMPWRPMPHDCPFGARCTTCSRMRKTTLHSSSATGSRMCRAFRRRGLRRQVLKRAACLPL
jgi:hypothetical protein